MKRILILSLALAFMALTEQSSFAQEMAVPAPIPPEVGSSSPEVTPPPPPFTKFNIFSSGPITEGPSTNCSGVTCNSGACSCESFSGLKVNGLAGALLSGQLIFEGGYFVGQCQPVHGFATATAKTFTINFGLDGLACYDLNIAVDHLPVTGSYVVLGGSGGYGHAAGTGSFSDDMPNIYQTTARSLVFSGVIQKAK